MLSSDANTLGCRRQIPASKFYDYRLLYTRLQAIISATEDRDFATLTNIIRSGLVRNLGNISTPRLYNRAYAGTKFLIEDYVTNVALAVKSIANLETEHSQQSDFTSQAKLDLLHDTRQAFGRSTLVLQGGAIFGLCHLGVVKALHLRGLLPRIITGTATGALIAALVGIHTEDELLNFLNGDGIDLSAFARKDERNGTGAKVDRNKTHIFAILKRRITRFMREGYFLDVKVLEECVRANVGDLTFEEAYNRTKRILNITVSTSGKGGVPNLLNYITAPNVVSTNLFQYELVLIHYSSSGQLRSPQTHLPPPYFPPLFSTRKTRTVRLCPGPTRKTPPSAPGHTAVRLTANRRWRGSQNYLMSTILSSHKLARTSYHSFEAI
jgi:TAG lipase / lysophosphatidylethanolamine acyltransferase